MTAQLIGVTGAGTLSRLRDEAEDLLEQAPRPETVDDTARLVHLVRTLRTTLGHLERDLERHAYAQWRAAKLRGIHEVDGLGVVQVRKGSDRKAWQHEELLPKVIETRLIDAGGEIPDPFTIARWVTEAAGLSYWRAGKLRDLGIDPDDYCESSPGKPTVQITAVES